MKYKVLFASSSVGLGHVTRDFYLSLLMDFADIDWLTSGMAVEYLKDKNANISLVSYDLASLGDYVGSLFRGSRLHMGMEDARGIYRVIRENSRLISEYIDFEAYDCIISDEAWELLFIEDLPVPRIYITDFTKFKASRFSIWQRLAYWFLNREINRRVQEYDLKFYVGFSGDAGNIYRYYGIIPTHWPVDTYEEEDYILINIGGTDAGTYIAEYVASILGSEFETVIVGGSKYFDPNPLDKILGAKLVITTAGYGSLVELIMNKKRGIIIPLEGHFEQEDNAKVFVGRSGYRVVRVGDLGRVDLRRLANEVLSEEPDPPRVADGSIRIVRDIAKLLEESKPLRHIV